jgi:dihydroflavonol-4-reductase
MILITGATGLVGSHLLIQLTQQGHPCKALYRNHDKIKDVKALYHYYYPEESSEKWDGIQSVSYTHLRAHETG